MPPLPLPPQHVCSTHCQIEHCFGNLYRCQSTGISHVCDFNCNQRLFYDNYSSICRLSRKIFLNSEVEMAQRRSQMMKKRGSGRLRDSEGSPMPGEEDEEEMGPAKTKRALSH